MSVHTEWQLTRLAKKQPALYKLTSLRKWMQSGAETLSYIVWNSLSLCPHFGRKHLKLKSFITSICSNEESKLGKITLSLFRIRIYFLFTRKFYCKKVPFPITFNFQWSEIDLLKRLMYSILFTLYSTTHSKTTAQILFTILNKF